MSTRSTTGRRHEYLRDAILCLLTEANQYTPGEELNPSYLSRRLGIPWNTAKRTLDRLLEMGYVSEANGLYRIPLEKTHQFRGMIWFLIRDRECAGRMLETDFPKFAPKEFVMDGVSRLLVRTIMNHAISSKLGEEQLRKLVLRKEEGAPRDSLLWEGLEEKVLESIRQAASVSEAIDRVYRVTHGHKLAILQLPRNVSDPLMVLFKVCPTLIYLSMQETPMPVDHLPFKGELEQANGKRIEYVIPGLMSFIGFTALSVDSLFFPQTQEAWKKTDVGASIGMTIRGERK